MSATIQISKRMKTIRGLKREGPEILLPKIIAAAYHAAHFVPVLPNNARRYRSVPSKVL
jgi:hypothetical protein